MTDPVKRPAPISVQFRTESPLPKPIVHKWARWWTVSW